MTYVRRISPSYVRMGESFFRAIKENLQKYCKNIILLAIQKATLAYYSTWISLVNKEI